MGAVVHGGTVNFAQARFIQTGGFNFSGSTPTEADAAYRAPKTGTIQKGKIVIEGNTLDGPCVVTVRVAGIDVLTKTIPAATDGDFDIPGVASVVEGQRVTVKFDATPGATSGQLRSMTSYDLV